MGSYRRYRVMLASLGMAAAVAAAAPPVTARDDGAGVPSPSPTAAVQVTTNPDPGRAHSTPQLARNPKTGELVIGESEIRTKKSCDIHISVDDGVSWFDGGSPMVKPYTDCSLQATNGPYITLQFVPDGTLFAAFFASDPKYEATLNRNDIPRNIYLARSEDSGRHWSTSLAYEGKEGDPGIGGSRRAQLAVDPQNPVNVYVGWQKGGYSTPAPGGARKGMMSISHDGGRTFSEPVELSDERGGGQPRPAVDSKGVVHVVFAADTFGTPTGDAAPPRPLIYRHSVDHGRTWSAPQVIDPGNVGFSFGRRQLLAVDPKTDALYVTWHGNSNPRARRPAVGAPSTPEFDDREIMVRSSHDGGSTWSDAKIVNDDVATRNIQHYDPGISVAPNGRVDLVWYDFRNSPTPENEAAGGNGGGMNDIYWSSTTDGAASFVKNVRVNDRIMDRSIGVWSNNVHSQTSVAIASSDDAVYVAWQDTRNGNATTNIEDIYFAKVRLTAGPPKRPGKPVPGALVIGAGAAMGMGLTALVALALARRRA